MNYFRSAQLPSISASHRRDGRPRPSSRAQLGSACNAVCHKANKKQICLATRISLSPPFSVADGCLVRRRRGPASVREKGSSQHERRCTRPDPSRLFRVAALFAAGSCDLAKYSITFVVRSGGEIQFRGQATIRVLASEAQPPEPVDRYRRAARVQERAF